MLLLELNAPATPIHCGDQGDCPETTRKLLIVLQQIGDVARTVFAQVIFDW